MTPIYQSRIARVFSTQVRAQQVSAEKTSSPAPSRYRCNKGRRKTRWQFNIVVSVGVCNVIILFAVNSQRASKTLQIAGEGPEGVTGYVGRVGTEEEKKMYKRDDSV